MILTELKKELPRVIDGQRRVVALERKIKIKYDSKGHNITRHLFGYGPWTEKKSGKVYRHRAVHGLLQETPAYRCGNACIVVPSEMEQSVKASIEKEGGIVKSVIPITMTPEESERMVRTYHIDYFKTLEDLLTKASTVNREEEFEDCLNRSIALTKKFKSHLKEALEYTEEEKKALETANRVFKGLQSVSKEDFETGKLEAQFVAKNIEKEYAELAKSSGK